MSHGSIDLHTFSGVHNFLEIAAPSENSAGRGWEIKIHEKGKLLVAEILDVGS